MYKPPTFVQFEASILDTIDAIPQFRRCRKGAEGLKVFKMENQTVLYSVVSKVATLVDESALQWALEDYMRVNGDSNSFYVLVLFSADEQGDDVVSYHPYKFSIELNRFVPYHFTTPAFLKKLAHRAALKLIEEMKYPSALVVSEVAA